MCTDCLFKAVFGSLRENVFGSYVSGCVRERWRTEENRGGEKQNKRLCLPLQSLQSFLVTTSASKVRSTFSQFPENIHWYETNTYVKTQSETK